SSCIAAHFRKEAHELAYAAAQQRVALQLPSGDWQVWLTPPPHLGEDPEHLTHWQVLANMSLTEKGTWRMSLNRNHGFPPSEKALKQRFGNLLADLAQMTGARECLLNLRDLPPLQMLTEDADALAGLARILQLAAAELQLVFTATGRVDHTLVAASAREALGESDAPSELAMRFGTALRHLLVDEFQDTSIEQFALIEALVGGWQANDGRSLFLVGDPMQSIYQFRAAEVGLFLRARARGIGALQLESLALTRNFRSLPVVTNWVNAAFAQLLPASDDLRSSAVQFLAADAAGSGAPPGEVTVHALDSADAGSEAQRVLGIVRQARARDAGASMAILVASRRHAAVIAATLRAAGVPVRGIDLEPLATRPAVRDLTALTRALLRPADRSSWLAVLRAPWCGLSLVDLTALCASDALITELLREQERVATLSETGSRNLRRCAPLLLEAVECRGRTELAALVESTWLRLGGPATCNAAALRDAEGFFIALYAQEIDGTLDEGSLDLLTDALFTQGEGDAAGAVEVLTIHRAKGLEWDVVILPGLGHRMQSDASPLLRWIELPRGDSGTDLLMATLSLGNPDASDPLNEYIKGLQKQRLANEKVRLAYVAATRARRELHLLGHAPLDARTDLPAPPASSLLRVLWPAIETQYVPGAGNAAVATAPTRLQQFLYRLPPDWQSPPLPSDVGVIALPLTQEEAEITEYSWVGLTARAIGTVVHAELEALAHEDTWPPAGFANRRERHETSLRQLGVEASARPAAIVRIEAALRKTLADKRAAWIFSPAHRERAAELRLSGMVDDRLVNISIDRTFIDERGTRWVIDFKTSTHEGADLQGFLAQETERYQPQLQRYAQLARHLGPEPVRAAIYFPLLGEFREI
ncbi:MAG: 3'-5' exonuclease, partial [Steroidobacteraceae bacterium]